MITYDTSPARYRHWALAIDAPIATLTAVAGPAADEPAPFLLGEIELADALQRLCFEYPDVSVVVLKGAADLRRAVDDWRAECGLVLVEEGAEAVAVARARAEGGRGAAAEAVGLGPLWREEFDRGFAYPNVRVEIDSAGSEATITIVGPVNHECFAPDPGPKRLRSRWWPLAVCREFADALLLLPANWPALRRVVLRTEGDPLAVASADVALSSGFEHDWFVREVVLFWRRTLQRLDRMSPSVVAVVEPGSCFVGTLLELALAAHEVRLGAPAPAGTPPAEIFLTGMNFGPLPRADGLTRLESRFADRREHLAGLARRVGDPVPVAEAVHLGLVNEAGDHAPGVSGTSR